MDWKECKKAFYVDGSLRDIYVQNTTATDWGKFLDLVSSLKTASFRDGEPDNLPTQVAEIFEGTGEASLLLQIDLGKVKLNCHFFTIDEIELDVDPKEVTSQQELDAVIDVLVDVGKSLNKDVILTDENSPNSRWFVYEYSTEKVKFIND